LYLKMSDRERLLGYDDEGLTRRLRVWHEYKEEKHGGQVPMRSFVRSVTGKAFGKKVAKKLFKVLVGGNSQQSISLNDLLKMKQVCDAGKPASDEYFWSVVQCGKSARNRGDTATKKQVKSFLKSCLYSHFVTGNKKYKRFRRHVPPDRRQSQDRQLEKLLNKIMGNNAEISRDAVFKAIENGKGPIFIFYELWNEKCVLAYNLYMNYCPKRKSNLNPLAAKD